MFRNGKMYFLKNSNVYVPQKIRKIFQSKKRVKQHYP